MDQMLSFTVGMSRESLTELATNMHGLDGLDEMAPSDISGLLQEVIASSLDDYLGEADEVAIQHIGRNGEEETFDLQISKATLNDLVLNEHGIETIDEIEPDKVAGVVRGLITDGLIEFTGEVGELRVVRGRHR